MKKKKITLFSVLNFIVSTAIIIVMIFPVYWMVVSSVMSQDELLSNVPKLIPTELHFENYVNVFKRTNMFKYTLNTCIMTFGVLALQLVVGLLAAYGFSQGKFKGKKLFYYMILGLMMVPGQVTFIPEYIMISKWGWVNTFTGLIVPQGLSVFFIFLMRNAFNNVDKDIIEAGKMDGLGRFGLIFHVFLPMTKTIFTSSSLILFINSWNNYFWPKIMTTTEDIRVLTIGIAFLKKTYAGDIVANYNEIMAGALIASLPIIILFFAFQKYMFENKYI